MNKQFKSNDDIKKIIIEKVITSIEDNKKLLWSKKWSLPAPINIYSGHEYSGINYWLLSMLPDEFYISFNQIKSLGMRLKKESKSVPVIFFKCLYKNIEKSFKISEKEYIALSSEKKKEYKAIPLLRYYSIFQLSDCNNIPDKITKKKNDLLSKYGNMQNKSIDNIEKFIKSFYPDEFNNGTPAYLPIEDKIRMPKITSYDNSDNYYQDILHELSHWTGYKDRLNRIQSVCHGDHKYSKEELIAELSACYLANKFKFDFEIDNSIAYLQGWLKALKNDFNLLFNASEESKKVIEYLKV